VPAPAAVYGPRNPQDLDYYCCSEDNIETVVQIYDEHFSRQYGFWRPYVEQAINASRGKRQKELTGKNNPPYTSAMEKQCFIK
jgi:hypothetical protein